MNQVTEHPEYVAPKINTPGPWVIEDGEFCAYIVAGNKAEVVAEVPESENQVADANLIAAAPELLESLKRLVGLLDTVRVYPGGTVDMEGLFQVAETRLINARAAIKKAQP